MTTEQVIAILQSSPDYTEDQVENAVREALSGRHGEFLQRVLLEMTKDGLQSVGATPDEVKRIQYAMVEATQ